MTVRLTRLTIGDRPEAWAAAGFDLRSDSLVIGQLTIDFEADRAGEGILDWTFGSSESHDDVDELDGLRTSVVALSDTPPEPVTHPNGASSADHVVVLTSDVERSLVAFRRIGLRELRRREATVAGSPVVQVFLRPGEVIVELVGPPDPDPSGSAATFFGLAVITPSIDGLEAVLGERVGPVRPAVQPGRRRRSVRHAELGISVPLLFLSPEGE